MGCAKSVDASGGVAIGRDAIPPTHARPLNSPAAPSAAAAYSHTGGTGGQNDANNYLRSVLQTLGSAPLQSTAHPRMRIPSRPHQGPASEGGSSIYSLSRGGGGMGLGTRVVLLEGHANAGEAGVIVGHAYVGADAPLLIDLERSGEQVMASRYLVVPAGPMSLLRQPSINEGDRVHISETHGDAPGQRGWVTSRTNLGATFFFTITLDNGSTTHGGPEYLTKANDDGAARPEHTKMAVTGKDTDKAILEVLLRMNEAPEWAEAQDTLSKLAMDEPTECIICTEPLCEGGPVGVLKTAETSESGSNREEAGSGTPVTPTKTRRVCNHFFHMECLRQVFMTKSLSRNCPTCRVAFEQYQSVPDIRKDPHGWFSMVDARGDHKLTLQEVLPAVQCILPVEANKLYDELTRKRPGAPGQADSPSLWERWAQGGGDDSVIFVDGFLNPKGGLLVWVMAMLRELHRQNMQNGKSLPSLLDRDSRQAWFEFWDFTGCGVMTKQQIVRALVISFQRLGLLTPGRDNVSVLFSKAGSMASNDVSSPLSHLPGPSTMDTSPMGGGGLSALAVRQAAEALWPEFGWWKGVMASVDFGPFSEALLANLGVAATHTEKPSSSSAALPLKL